MSERGSFTTEYIYCPECFLAAKKALNNGNFQIIEHNLYPIVCGKAGGLWKNEEVFEFEQRIKPVLEKSLCKYHSIKVAVLCDGGKSEIFIVKGVADNVIRLTIPDEKTDFTNYLKDLT